MLRELFVLDPDIVFLNHGSFGACPAEVLEAQHRLRLEMERNPVEFLARRFAKLLYDARKALAEYVGASADDLVFVSNATSGVNAVAHGLALEEGDEVLATDHEYGACDNAFELFCRRRKARYIRAEIPLPFRPEELVDRIFARVTSRTKLIFASHITSTTALIFPVKELCERARAAGIATLIDGAHAPGQIPLDLASVGADFYVGNCHKWLCAPKGAGFLYARPERHAEIHAPVVSWGYGDAVEGHTGFESYTGRTLLERRLQWQGTGDPTAALSVPAAIEFQARRGWDAVRRECHALLVDLVARAREKLGFAPVAAPADFGQMAVIPVPETDPTRLKDRLFDEFRIEVPVTSHGGRLFVRASVQGYNTKGECDALLDALVRIFENRRRVS